MEEPEAFIVTVECADGKIELDMELPAELPIGEVRMKLLDVLKNQYAGQFDNWGKCRLVYGNCSLKDNDTLARAGAFDGSRLTVVSG